MDIALIGYGKMGKTIEDIAVERGHRIVARVNSSNPVESVDLSEADVAIEFTKPQLAVHHIEYCAQMQIPVVVGTTAWSEQLDDVKEFIYAQNAALLYASNFSIGVNVFFEINRKLTRLLKNYPYNIAIEEIHHTEKLDAPSGTAVSLANDILFENDKITSWIHQENYPPVTGEGQLGVTSHRREHVPGTHIVSFSSDIDTIEIKHTAHNRKGFALGAVIAAEWLSGKKGVYTMNDLIKF